MRYFYCLTRFRTMVPPPATSSQLARVVGLPGAVLLGLGSILGTGVYVSIGLGASLANSAVVTAIAIAAVVAICNGLSSAQLAANHPVSGGTYEYGYRYAHPKLGFLAGWMFLCAKSASAATAALGVAGYALVALDAESFAYRTPIALGFVLLWTWIVAGGMRRSNLANTLIVSLTLLGLGAFVLGGLVTLQGEQTSAWQGWWPAELEARTLLEAVALLFVAFTGYGRVATLGEEVRDPARTIPRAVIATLALTAVIYVAVGFVLVSLADPSELARITAASAAPLEVMARSMNWPALAPWIGFTAITAMAGVLLNLLLGLSRVLLAMARRGDMPPGLARIEATRGSPAAAVWTIGVLIAALVLIGDVYATWSFSAFTVLIYYAITNLCALRLPTEQRRFPRVFAWGGLASCLFLAFWVQPIYWLFGLGLIGVGFAWQGWMHRSGRP